MSPQAKKLKTEQLAPFSSKYYSKPLKVKSVLSRYVRRQDLKPLQALQNQLDKTEKERKGIKHGGAVVHLFNRDLRVADNNALSEASSLASSAKLPLIGLYIVCDEELFAHNVSPFQLEYRIRSLKALKKSLSEIHVPLAFLRVEKLLDLVNRVTSFCEEHNASHLFSNIEYEVDELRFFQSLVTGLLGKQIAFFPYHNTCVVTPGVLTSKSKGTQYSVFSPWYRAWCEYIKKNGDVLETAKVVAANKEDTLSENVKSLFESEIPSIPTEKKLSTEKSATFDELYKCGEHEAKKHFEEYIHSDDAKEYAEQRNSIDANILSHLSVHISSGTISTRSIIRYMIESKLVKHVDLGDKGLTEWIRQIAWRDFYKHILCNWPHVCMFKPFLLEYEDLEWEYNQEHFSRWCNGQTGYPIVDAAMRELNATGFLPNRCRMIVASFLSKHLLIDWRYGEYYFADNLIDTDFASNNGGWGFSASVGVDPQPYFRIFNPWLQSEKFDSEGSYIRKWIPELKQITDNKAVHNPYERGFAKEAENNGYPKPMIDHAFARERALSRFKEARG